MFDLLGAARAAFGPAPRTLPYWENLTPPSWMKSDDALRATYGRAHALLRAGDIVWGHVVQANSLLFTPGEANCPAGVVFSADPERDLQPDTLSHAAGAAFTLKGRTFSEDADSQVARIARALNEELVRHPALDLPHSVSRGFPMRMAILMIHRIQLPSGYLSTSALPLVASPERDEVTLLPTRYWGEDLVRSWLALSASRG